MVQYGDFFVLSRLLKIVQIFRLASVVYQNDILKAVFQQSVHHGDQLFIRVQRRQDHGDIGKVGHRFRSFGRKTVLTEIL